MKKAKKERDPCFICEHGFTRHSPICQKSDCLCLLNEAENLKRMILERGLLNKPFDDPAIVLIVKSYIKDKENRYGNNVYNLPAARRAALGLDPVEISI